MITHIGAVFLEGKYYFQHFVKFALLLKPPLGLWIVEIITYFEAVFLRDKGLRTACKNSIATKTSSFLVLVFFVIIPHFEAVFFTEKVLINTYQILVATETLYQFR